MATQDDHVLAADLATGAGALLLEVRGRLAADGAPAAVLKDEGDRLAHAFLMDALAAARPGAAVSRARAAALLPPCYTSIYC